MTRSPYVSDHAVLRYLERHRGINTDAVRQAIADKVRAAMEMGALNVTVDGVCFALDGSTVVTVLPRRPNNYSRQKHYSRGRGNGS